MTSLKTTFNSSHILYDNCWYL